MGYFTFILLFTIGGIKYCMKLEWNPDLNDPNLSLVCNLQGLWRLAEALWRWSPFHQAAASRKLDQKLVGAGRLALKPAPTVRVFCFVCFCFVFFK